MLTSERGETLWNGKWSPTSIKAVAAGYGNTYVYGYSFFVGIPGIDPFGVRHNVKAMPDIGADAYSVTSGNRRTMIPTTDGICQFTSVAGVDDTHKPTIYRSFGMWRMVTTTATAAKARCYLFNQNQP
jgi:hypothetical protein